MAKSDISNEESPGIQMVRGFPFPSASWFDKKRIEDSLDYVPHDEDIIVASYPKTGTTWLQYIVLQITTNAEIFPSFDDVTYRVVPFMELAGVEAVEALKKPRIYKHHFPYNIVHKNDKSKYLYIYRNPEDTLVSFYHFSQNLNFLEGIEFDTFFERFITGDIGYGLYFDHVLSYFAHKGDSNLLLISYEKLHANRRGEILRIAKFLGEEYYLRLQEDEVLLDKVIEHTSFDYMKKNLTLTHPTAILNKEDSEAKAIEKQDKTVHFFRKGVVGDGKNKLSAEQRQRLNNTARAKLDGTELIAEWFSDGNN